MISDAKNYTAFCVFWGHSHGIPLVDTAIQHEAIMCISVPLLIKDAHHVFIIHNTAFDLQVLGFLKIYLF